ncbi:unnamed protein product [Closterium sp. Naga37s-1]|nr:unnamed protein product [Closterium sp. Naga37s-1]
MCAHISGNLLSALQTAGLNLPPQKLTRGGAVPDVSEMSGVVQETSSEVQTLKKEVAALRADYADLQSNFSSVSKQLCERVAALEKARETANKEAMLGAHGQPDVASPSKRPGTSRPAPPQRPVAPLPAATRPPAPIYQGFAAMPPYAPPPGMPFYWQGAPPPHAPPPQQSYPPPAIPSMSGAGEGGVEWMRDSGGEAGVAGARSDAFNGGRAKSRYAGVTGGGDAWFAKLLMPAPQNPIRMGPFPSEEEAAKGYKAAAVVVRPQSYRIQRSIELTLSEQQLLTGCTRQHVASLAERGLWHRWREWRQIMPELAPAPLLQVPGAATMLPPRPQAQPSSSQATQPPGMAHSRTPGGHQQYLEDLHHYN